MRLGKIDVPRKLLDSLEKDQLVLFVGAGASFDQPSNLPLFDDLAVKVAEGTLDREEGEPFERFLGRVEQEAKINVHRRAAQILSPTDSRPNELHQLVAALFNTPEQVKIVTTNFDLHLETSLQGRFEDSAGTTEIFAAPALPNGAGFQGLVYLHGRLSPDPSRIVLTDRDFGRAYLTEGWARRFLLDLFQSYDVLFVGYSHSDQILNYLARGLPPDTQRLRAAIAEGGEDSRWRFLGIRALTYVRGEHQAVKETLQGWTHLRSLTAQGHESEVNELVARPIELLTQQGSDHLRWIVRNEKYRHFFFHKAKDAEWLDWADSHGLLAPVFDSTLEDREIISWFAEDLLAERGDTAIATVHRHSREKLTYLSWQSVARTIWISARRTDGKLPEAEYHRLVQWIAILRSHAEPGCDWQILAYLVDALDSSAEDLILELLHALTEPQLVTSDQYLLFSDSGRPWGSDITYRMPGSTHSLQGAWGKTIVPNLDRFATPILNLVREQLERIYRLQRSVGNTTSTYDPESTHRTTIEESDQTRHPESTIDILVRSGRDALVWLAENQPSEGRAIIELWLRNEAPLLQRIALYGASLHPRLTAIQKVKYLLSGGRINSYLLHHEVFLLLRNLYPSLKKPWRKRLLETKRRLLAEERSGAEGTDPEVARRTSHWWFSFLEWLRRADPECELVNGELATVKARYPEFKEPRPELTHYIEEGVYRESARPLSVEEMLQLAPEDLLSRYQQYLQRTRVGDPDLSTGLRQVLSEAAKTSFEWSFAQARHLLSLEGLDDEIMYLVVTLLDSWRESDLTNDDWISLLDVLEANSPSDSVRAKVIDLLEYRLRSKGDVLDCRAIQRSAHLGLKLWGEMRAEVTAAEPGDDPLQRAMNHPDGELALFAVQALSRAVKLDCSTPDENPELWKLLRAFADGVKDGRTYGAVVLASQLHFMLYADEDWTSRSLMPLFDWERVGTVASHLWGGFFFWGRLSPLVIKNVVPLLTQLARNLDNLPERVRERANEYMAGIAFRDSGSPVGEIWFREYLGRSSDQDRQHFAWHLREILSELWDKTGQDGVETGDALWDRLLSEYLSTRLSTGGIGQLEWAAVALWCSYLDERVPGFVELFVKGPPPYDQHTEIFHRLGEGEHLYSYPDSIACFVVHLLSGQRREAFWYHDDVRGIVTRLRKAKASPALVEEVINKALELGASSSSFGEDSGE